MLRYTLVVVSALLAAPALALAQGGVSEINHARVLAGGITPGDTAGYPATISVPGSYRLTGDLALVNDDAIGISITADDVTLDLGGFTIGGPIVCTAGGAPPDVICEGLSLPTSGHGVSGGTADRVTVRNGRVRGAGVAGIRLGATAVVEGVVLESNGGDGLVTGLSSSVRQSSAILNGSRGFDVGSSSRIEGCVANSNGTYGIQASTASVVIGNVANANILTGILAAGALLDDNVTNGNQGYGVAINNGGGMRGGTAIGNADGGVICTAGCNLIDSTIAGNGGPGVLGVDGAYRGNIISGNAGTIPASWDQTGPNQCDGDLTCP